MTTFVDPGVPTIELDLEKLDASLRRLAAVLPENARLVELQILRGPHDRGLRRRPRHLARDGEAPLGRLPRLAAARPAANMNLERERQLLRLVEEALAWPPRPRSPPAGRLAHDPSLLEEVRAMLTAADSVNESLPTQMPLGPALDEARRPSASAPIASPDCWARAAWAAYSAPSAPMGCSSRSSPSSSMRRTRLPEQLAGQFARERQILARLRHPNIAQLFDGGVTPEGLSYFVMELVEGRPISQYAVEERLTVRELLMVFRQVCAAVQYAHAHLVVHGDIKPNNIVVTPDGVAKLLDFGVARVIEDSGAAQRASAQTDAPSASRITTRAPRAGAALRRPPRTTSIRSGSCSSELLNRIQGVCSRSALHLHARDRGRSRAAIRVGGRARCGYRALAERRARARAWTGVGLRDRPVPRTPPRAASSASAAGVLLLIGAAIAHGGHVRARRAREGAGRSRTSTTCGRSRATCCSTYDRLESVPRALTLRRDIAEKGQQYLDRLSRDPVRPLMCGWRWRKGLRRLSLVQGGVSSASLANVKLAEAEPRARRSHRARAARRCRAMGAKRAFAITRILIARSRMLDRRRARPRKRPSAISMRPQAALAPWRAKDPTDQEARDLAIDLVLERVPQLFWQGKYREAVALARRGLALEASVAPTDRDARREALRKPRAALRRAGGKHLLHGRYGDGRSDPIASTTSVARQLAEEEPQNLHSERMYTRALWALGGTLLEMGPDRQAEAEQLLSQVARSSPTTWGCSNRTTRISCGCAR